MGKLCSQDVCTGCFACKQVCAKGAINITEVGGFLYPEIDASLCVDCGLCTRACPVLNTQINGVINDKEKSSCYALWNNNVDERMNSSSGGAFSVLANKIIEEEGIVYGAAWDSEMHLKHMGVEDISRLDALRRSKYLQSNTDGVFKDVKIHLQNSRKVLFCGTPCQIGGLLAYLGNKEYPNLITVGVICHGVPSQKSFNKYISEVEEKERIKISDCNFRSKKWGWRADLNLLLTGRKSDGKYITINRFSTKNVFMNAYIKSYFYRESCYNCPFKDEKSYYEADIMISDFWNLSPKVPYGTVDFGKGVSAVITNTEKGKALLMQCTDSTTLIERPYSEYAANSGLKNSRKPYNNSEAFEYLKTHSWMETQSKFFPLTYKWKYPLYARRILGENFFLLIKKIFNTMRLT